MYCIGLLPLAKAPCISRRAVTIGRTPLFIALAISRIHLTAMLQPIFREPSIMNPLRFVTSPFSTLTRAVTAPLNFVFVVGLCFFINWMVSPGHWWVKWVAFGMGIYVIVAWARALKLLFVVGVLAAIGYFIYKRYGAEAKAKYDAWRKDGEPKQPADAVQFLLESQVAQTPKATQGNLV